MKRTLLYALAFLFSLVLTSQAHAWQTQKPKLKIKSEAASMEKLFLPVRLFVTVTQKPVMSVGWSITGILRHILGTQARTKGLPVVQRVDSRI